MRFPADVAKVISQEENVLHHVMFDVDGTLVQSMEFDSDLFARAVEEVVESAIDQNWTIYKNVTDSGILTEVISSLGLNEKQKEIEEKVKRNFFRKISEHLKRFPAKEVSGAASFLNRLCAMEDVNVSIATGGWYETALLKLKSAGLFSRRITIASSSDHHQRTEIMKISKIRSGSETDIPTTYFGDAPWDKTACEKLGYNFVQVGVDKIHDQWISNFNDHHQALAFIGL